MYVVDKERGRGLFPSFLTVRICVQCSAFGTPLNIDNVLARSLARSLMVPMLHCLGRRRNVSQARNDRTIVRRSFTWL